MAASTSTSTPAAVEDIVVIFPHLRFGLASTPVPAIMERSLETSTVRLDVLYHIRNLGHRSIELDQKIVYLAWRCGNAGDTHNSLFDVVENMEHAVVLGEVDCQLVDEDHERLTQGGIHSFFSYTSKESKEYQEANAARQRAEDDAGKRRAREIMFAGDRKKKQAAAGKDEGARPATGQELANDTTRQQGSSTAAK